MAIPVRSMPVYLLVQHNGKFGHCHRVVCYECPAWKHPVMTPALTASVPANMLPYH